jgi:hypothetical protein
MLISMPTGTSTIFGVFQAILALLLKPDELRPGDKLIPFKKFASEIFLPCPPQVLCCVAAGTHGFVRPLVKPKADQRVQSRRQRAGC